MALLQNKLSIHHWEILHKRKHSGISQHFDRTEALLWYVHIQQEKSLFMAKN